MRESKGLRYAAQKIYEDQSVKFSDCYDLEGLKKIKFIFVPSDAPANVLQIVKYLQKEISRKYPEISPEIIKVSPLFSQDKTQADVIHAIYDTSAQYLQKQEGCAAQSMIICDSEAATSLMLKRRDIKDYDEKYIPLLLLDVYSFTNDIGPLDHAAFLLNISPKLITAYEPYHRKKCKDADILLVLASEYECWNDLIDIWHKIASDYGKKAQIAYIEDLAPWTSQEYADKVFQKFKWLVAKTHMSNSVDRLPAYAYNVSDYIAQKKAIICLPQKQSYWIYKIRQASSIDQSISFDICPQDFNTLWNSLGAIGKQFFCQDLKNLAEITSSPDTLNGYNLHKRFSKWNLRLFWWNYRICVKNSCLISYLSY